MTAAHRWAPLAVAAALLFAAALKYPTVYSDAIMAAGLIMLGAWLATEIADPRRRSVDRPEEEDTRDDDRSARRD